MKSGIDGAALYSGEVNQNLEPDGRGIIVFEQEGKILQGYWKERKMHGRGIWIS